MKIPSGYTFASAYAGIRHERKDDLAFIVSASAASAAAVFTTNQVQAAPVRIGKEHLERSGGKVRAVLVNAGNANCATRTGESVTRECCRAVAERMKIPVEQVFPSSTGIIGVELDPKQITRKLPSLEKGLSENRLADIADAIMTTDTVPKIASVESPFKDGRVRIAGVTKGSGMIHPNMATTLGFLLTDAAIEPAQLKGMLVQSVETSYHRLTVDGDTSTNDTVLLLANGASGVTLRARERKTFQSVLEQVMQDLARKVARDGEGARKLVTIDVEGASTDGDASAIARGIANSPLVKTAVAGGDPNWGRVLVAAGYAGITFNPAKVDIYLQGTLVCQSGLAARFSERSVERKLAKSECNIRLVIRGRGRGKARFWTCDLTEGYVHINADYHT